MPTYRLPRSACNATPLDEVGMTSDTQRVEVPTTALSWYADEESDHIAGLLHPPSEYGSAQQPVAPPPDEEGRAGQPAGFQDLIKMQKASL